MRSSKVIWFGLSVFEKSGVGLKPMACGQSLGSSSSFYFSHEALGWGCLFDLGNSENTGLLRVLEVRPLVSHSAL